jgi:hypothetical protein
MKTKQDLLLDLLQDGQWHYSDELAKVADARFGDVVHKLKKKGCNILVLKEGSCNSLPKLSQSGQKSYYRLANAREVVTESVGNQLSLL